MTILDRAFAKSWLIPTFLCLIVFLLLFMLGDLFGLTGDLIKNPPSLNIFFEYLFYRSAYGLFFMAPLVGLIGSFWGLNEWKRNNEWTATLSSGQGPLRLLRVPVFLSVSSSVVLILYSTLLLPDVAKRANIIRDVQFKGQSPSQRHYRNLHLHLDERRVLNIGSLDPKNGKLTDVTITWRRNGDIQRRVDAQNGVYLNQDQWILKEATVRRFAGVGSIDVEQRARFPLSLVPPETLQGVFGNDPRRFDIGPEELTLDVLSTMINVRQRFGLNTSVEQIYVHWKFAYPVSVALLSLCGLLIAYKFNFARTSGVGLCMLLGFGYWVLLNTSLALGKSSTTSPPVLNSSLNLLSVYGPQLLTFFAILAVGRWWPDQ